MKRCASCGEEKPLDAFYRDNRFLDKPPRAACKDCINARQRTPKKRRPAQPKACSKCGVLKPPHEFFNDPKHADGLRADCKACNVAGRAEQQRAWQRANPEKLKATNRKHRAARGAWTKEWRKQNPDIVAMQYARKRAKRLSNSEVRDLTPKQWSALKAAYGSCCAYCGKKLLRLTMDHVIPLTLGGAHTLANVVPACAPCNARKKNQVWQPALVFAERE